MFVTMLVQCWGIAQKKVTETEQTRLGTNLEKNGRMDDDALLCGVDPNDMIDGDALDKQDRVGMVRHKGKLSHLRLPTYVLLRRAIFDVAFHEDLWIWCASALLCGPLSEIMHCQEEFSSSKTKDISRERRTL